MEKTELLLKEISTTVGEPRIELNYSGSWQLLVAVILSAQCTDIRVNKVTDVLFEEYAEINNYLNIDEEELQKIVYSTGFFKNKAGNIMQAAKYICESFDCVVPVDMENLITVPGVGRKTANVVISAFKDSPEGIVVDTHVKRVARRLGFTKSENPVIIEKELMTAFKKSIGEK